MPPDLSHRCPHCSHDPMTMLGKPIGMYHCPECEQMVIAGFVHPEHRFDCPRYMWRMLKMPEPRTAAEWAQALWHRLLGEAKIDWRRCEWFEQEIREALTAYAAHQTADAQAHFQGMQARALDAERERDALRAEMERLREERLSDIRKVRDGEREKRYNVEEERNSLLCDRDALVAVAKAAQQYLKAYEETFGESRVLDRLVQIPDGVLENLINALAHPGVKRVIQ